MARPLWFVKLLKKTFPNVKLIAKLTNLPILGKIIDYLLIRGDDIIYLPQDKILEIDKDLIRSKGAVSREVCIDMAAKVMSLFKTDYSLAVTGFAGPEYEGDNLGLVFCCIRGPSEYHSVFEKRFLGNRTEIKFRTTQFVLNELRNAIRKEGR